MRAREPDVWSIRASTKVREPTGAVPSTAHLPAEEKGAHKSHLSVGQVVEIFKRKTSKTGGTASLLSQQYGVGDRTIRDIWGGKTWAKETRPFWTPLEHQQSLASGASVEAENSVQSGQGPDSGATHHGTDTHLPAVEKGAHMRHLTAGQVVEIFKRKTSKTVGTSSLTFGLARLGQKRRVRSGRPWNISNHWRVAQVSQPRTLQSPARGRTQARPTTAPILICRQRKKGRTRAI